jgi:hypothetical protein
MRPNEAFKLGFLTRCVEEGLSSAQTNALAKRAADVMTKQGFTEWLSKQIFNPIRTGADTVKAVTDAGTSLAMPAMALTVGVPASLGGLAAYLHNKATDVTSNDVDSAKNQELLETYRRMTDQLERKKQLRNYKQQRKRTGQVFL